MYASTIFYSNINGYQSVIPNTKIKNYSNKKKILVVRTVMTDDRNVNLKVGQN